MLVWTKEKKNIQIHQTNPWMLSHVIIVAARFVARPTNHQQRGAAEKSSPIYS